MQSITKRDLAAMLLIDCGVFVVLILGIVIWYIVSKDYSRAMAWDDLKQGAAFALISGPFFVLVSKLMDKAESEAL
jgi:hypothetical protein